MRPYCRRPGTILVLVLAAALAGGPTPPAGAVPPSPRAALATRAEVDDLGPALAAGLDRPAHRLGRPPQRLLVLLVDFADRPHAGNWTPAAVDSAFFGERAGSVRDYYRRASGGRFQLGGQVSPWLRLPESYAFYADAAHEGRGVLGVYPHNARRMVEDAVRAAAGRVDFRAFDGDGPDGVPASGDDDGIVDALVVVHAGDGAELGDRRQILSHTWYTTFPVPSAGGVLVWTYATVSESSPLGVRAHEFGHLLGLPDLYDRRSSTRLGGGLGDWSLMASGAWLDGGRTPSDLDGASKVELGFVDPIVPGANAIGLQLRSGQAGPPLDVYQVWTHGLPAAEYFVIENRRPSAQDLFLPGGGMLVYHVDLSRPGNDDPEHPRVELLQADGRRDIERHLNNGDAGDPFPGSEGVVRLDAATTPGTRARDTSDSQVVVAGISAPTGSMRFDLQVESRPYLLVAGQSVRELEGNGDGIPAAGEKLAVDLLVRNLGLGATDVTVDLRAEPAAEAVWSVDRASLPVLAKLDSATLRFELRPAAGLGDPHGLLLRGEAAAADGFRQSFDRVLGLGAASGFQACLDPEPSRLTRGCSDPRQPWTVEVRRGQGRWQLERRAGEFGFVYRSAGGRRYANGVDVALVSPSFNLETAASPPRCELHLLHAYDIADFAAGWTQDGGRVELSLDGGEWRGLVPRGGYPRRFWPESQPLLAAEGAYAGQSPRRWDVFDLGEASGSARLRFRFVSDDSLAAAGWELARVLVVAPSAADTVLSLALVAEPNPVRFPTRVAFRIDAPLTRAAGPTTLRICDVRGRLLRTLVHVPVPAESGRFEWDGSDAAGHPVASGIYVARLEWGRNTAACKLVVLH